VMLFLHEGWKSWNTVPTEGDLTLARSILSAAFSGTMSSYSTGNSSSMSESAFFRACAFSS
jgi:hypothetical protein